MGIKKYTAYTPSRRHMTSSDFSEITKTTPEKSLTVSLKKNAGRNNQGKITVRHHGGGSRRKYRIVDFKRNSKDGIPATVIGIEYDPNRSANIALICYADGSKSYILAPGRQLPASFRNPGWCSDPQHRAVSGQGRPVGSFCRKLRTVNGKGRQIRHPSSSLRRDENGSHHLPRNYRRCRQW